MSMGMSSTGVFDISNVSTVSVIYMVGHSLKTTIRKQNMVFAFGCVPVTSFMLSEIRSSIVVMYFVFISVVDGYIMVRGVVGVVGSKSISVSIGGNGKEGKNGKSLHYWFLFAGMSIWNWWICSNWQTLYIVKRWHFLLLPQKWEKCCSSYCPSISVINIALFKKSSIFVKCD